MALMGISILAGQGVDSVLTVPEDYRPESPYVVNAFPRLPRSIGMPGDTLLRPIGLLEVPYGRRVLAVSVDRDWKYITFTEYIDDAILRLPFTAPVEWYFRQMLRVTRQLKFYEIVRYDHSSEAKDQARKGSKSLEVVGVELGSFGRASLRVRGNVNISGKMVFQDQELVRSSINETQNTHIEFDQKQNLNIEGKIGDRITVQMDQDSERDFDWENNIRISYEGAEDDIVQKVEAGNISLSLPSTQYVTFSGQNKGLFGLKAISKLGPVDVTTIASIEQTRKERQKYKGGSESKTQRIKDYEYVKNQYFFIHEWFRNGARSDTVSGYSGPAFVIPPFYPLVDGLHPVGNVTVRNFDLYRLDLTNDPGADVGMAYVDPLHPELYADDNKEGNFLRLERDVDYTLNEDLGYIRLRNRSQDEILGVHFTLVERETGEVILTVGHGITATDSTLSLKMIKPQSPHPNHPTWPLMFKNVYYLGTTNISPEGFAVRIVNDIRTPVSDRDPQGRPYITLFGLDSLNTNGDRQADELIDIDNTNIVNLVTGELMFPMFHPFADPDSLPGGNRNPALKGVLGKGLMYTSTIQTDITGDSWYTIEVDYTNPSSTISLGFMLVEGSEEVLLNGIPLKRGIDYQIDYFTGTIVLGPEAASPDANIEILYDKYELVSFDKKVILGTRAQMDLGEKSFVGLTALYFNQSVINEKIEVGYEPIRNFIWDVNGRFETGFEGLTRALDRLPVIETERVSTLSIEGEFAQVLPNPNPMNNPATGDPHGVAYIDDFEGAKRTTTPPIQRRFWRESSAPLHLDTGSPYQQRHRARMYWYNPYGQVRTKDIWPNLSTSIQAQNETTDILVLRYKTRSHQAGVPRDSIWAGITTAFYSGDYDQTQSKFFEIWLRGTEGKLTVDLGKISEDRDGNGVLNTEDVPESGLSLGNGFLEENEDTGYDGCFDEYEDGWGGCLSDSTYQQYLDYYLATGLPVPINTGADVDPDDPNGDNWDYVEGSSNYSKVNGTEGNGTGPRKQEGGLYPDTEDLDRSGFLDKNNDYFTKTFALNDTTYLAGVTVKDGKPTGWRLFRIPLSHFTPVKNIQWNEIRYLRLVWSGVDSTAALQIAKIELVGNEWQELGIAPLAAENYQAEGQWDHWENLSETKTVLVHERVNADSVFAVSVVNTDDNAYYRPPKGVKGEYDRINQIRSKEQSLVLKFNGLPPGYKGAAKKTILALSGDRAKSYLTYDRLKMYVYGDSPWIGTDQTEVELFLRFGMGNEYYEIIQPVYHGWDENAGRNAINLDLNWLTRLKLQDTTQVTKFRATDIFLDSADVKQYFFTDEDGELTGKRVTIKGSPALNRIQYFIVGVRNRANEPISGEVWLDELRLSGVKKDRGVAMRVQTKFNLADLANTSLVYSRKDADFHVLQQRLGTNNTSEDLRWNANLQLHKLLPKSWGLNIPLNTSYSNTINRPKYFPGTDILVDQSQVPDSILSKTESFNISTSISKSSKSDNKLLKYTIDNLKGSFSASRSRSSNEIMAAVRNESYSGKLSYNLTFGRDNYIRPLKWMEFLPWLGEKFSEFHLYYSPRSFTANIDVSEKLVQRESRGGTGSPDDYNLGLSRSFGLDYKFTESFTAKYNRSVKSDLDQYRGYAWYALRQLDPGIVTSTTENLTTSLTPELARWFKPNFNYSAGYRWEKPLGGTYEGARIGTQLRFSSSVSLSPVTIFELVYKPPVKKPPPRARGRRRRGIPPTPKPEAREEQKKEIPVLTKVHGWLKKIDPISLNYTETLNRTGNGVLGTVPVGYKFGWLPDHGLKHSDQVGINTGNWDHKRDFSTRSGIKFSRNVSISFTYTQNISRTISGSGVEQWSISRDYFAYGEKLENGFPFVGWSLRLTGVEKWPLIKRVARTASLEHAFSGKESRAWQFEGIKIPRSDFFDLTKFIEDHKEHERSSRVTTSFSPLLGLAMSLKRGISTNLRYNLTRSVEELPTGLTLRNDKTWTASMNYSHRGGLTIPLPFLEDFHIQNTINFTLNFDLNESETLGTKDKTSLAQQAFNSGWKIGTRISYSFTSRVSGGVIYEYRESKTKTTGRKIDRDFGFDVNIAISG
jgi:hypothetical protein